MNRKVKSGGIKCSQCLIQMELFYEDELYWKWICPQCKATIQGELPDQDTVRQMVEEIEQTRTTVYVKLNGLSQILQLRELVPELKEMSLAKIKEKLVQNQMKWPIQDYQMVIDAMRPLADSLGLEIISE